MKKITPFLWFNDNGGEAIEFYKNLFKSNARIAEFNMRDGNFYFGSIVIFGQELVIFNGGSHFGLTPAFSLYIDCDNQDEVDYYWNGFIENGGTPSRCGWLVDKYGVSWQVIPKMLPPLLHNSGTSQKIMPAMLEMSKIIIADIEAAAQK